MDQVVPSGFTCMTLITQPRPASPLPDPHQGRFHSHSVTLFSLSISPCTCTRSKLACLAPWDQLGKAQSGTQLLGQSRMSGRPLYTCQPLSQVHLIPRAPFTGARRTLGWGGPVPTHKNHSPLELEPEHSTPWTFHQTLAKEHQHSSLSS